MIKKICKQLNGDWSRVIKTYYEFNGTDYYGNVCCRIENSVKYHNQIFLFIIKIEYSGITVRVRNQIEDYLYPRTSLFANIRKTSSCDWYVEITSIDKCDNELQGKNGIGYLMMKFMFDAMLKYEEINNLRFKKVIGTIGVLAQDNPEHSIPMYQKFSKYKYDKSTNRYLILDVEHCNEIDQILYYSIEQKK